MYKNCYRTDSVRLKGWDYSSRGLYFITICTKKRDRIFGEIRNHKMFLNYIGKIACHYWSEIPSHFANTGLYEFIVMPDHVHSIIALDTLHCSVSNADHHRTNNNSCLNRNDRMDYFSQISPHFGSISVIIRSYKSVCTRTINAMLEKAACSIWKARYYDHIIRNEKELANIRCHIISNPVDFKRS